MENATLLMESTLQQLQRVAPGLTGTLRLLRQVHHPSPSQDRPTAPFPDQQQELLASANRQQSATQMQLVPQQTDTGLH